jgi:hypothetical protein
MPQSSAERRRGACIQTDRRFEMANLFGDPAIFGTPKTGGFASPPRGGFALRAEHVAQVSYRVSAGGSKQSTHLVNNQALDEFLRRIRRTGAQKYETHATHSLQNHRAGQLCAAIAQASLAKRECEQRIVQRAISMDCFAIQARV